MFEDSSHILFKRFSSTGFFSRYPFLHSKIAVKGLILEFIIALYHISLIIFSLKFVSIPALLKQLTISIIRLVSDYTWFRKKGTMSSNTNNDFLKTDVLSYFIYIIKTIL
jgi:hypothetical protein